MPNRMEKQGKINPEFVRQIVSNLFDLEVYLMEERKQHILESHPEAKDLLFFLPDLVESPDFTQRDPRPYTVRFCKESV